MIRGKREADHISRMRFFMARTLRKGRKILAHPVLGRLVYDDQLQRWDAHVDLRPGRPIDFGISSYTFGKPEVDVHELLDRAVRYLSWARRAYPMVRRTIADELLGLYNNGDWCLVECGGLGPMTRTAFLRRITPNSISLETNGKSDWYFHDGRLFAGHWIEVRVREDRTIAAVCLAG